MQIRVRATAVRSMTLLAILCFILEALVAYRVFALRDLQQAALQFQLNAQHVERALNPAAVFKDRNAPEPLASLAMLDRVIMDACCAVPLQLLNEAHKASNLNDYSRAYTELLRGLDSYATSGREQIAIMLQTNVWLPYIAAVVLIVGFLIAWQILQNNFLGPIDRLHRAVREADLHGGFDYRNRGTDPPEIGDLSVSFANLLSRLSGKLAGRELALREAKDMSRREADRVSSEINELFEGSPNPIFVIDKAGLIVTWNPKIAAMTNLPEIEAVGGNFEALCLSTGLERADFHVHFTRVLNGSSVDDVRLPLVSRGRSAVTIRTNLRPRRAFGGEIVGINCFGREVGGDLQPTVLEVEAQQSSYFSQLASSAAHQLNQPLQKMRLYLANAQNRLRLPTFDQDVLVEKLNGVDAELSTVSEIIDHLREFGRPIEPMPNGFQIGTVIERCLDLSRGSLLEQGIEVVLDCQLSDEIADGHPLQIEKPLIALLNNAREALLEGAPNQPKITIVATSDSADIAKIVVSDNGCGLVEEFRDRIFEPFFSTRTAGKNVGLGLSVAQAVMSELGGRLTLDSDNGWTVATMVVPLRPLTDAPVKKTT
ncbi:ATP-binding protein [Luminiphilus sp.]|nr:ATP-binding protein [Luminiphilus sp.]MDB3923251.1 ATP-binding protein [Luminiphilus sp.]